VGTHVDRCLAVVSLDLDAPDSRQTARMLHSLAEHPGVRGVRFFGVGGTEPTWLDDPERLIVWETAAELGLVVVATVFDRHLAALRRTLERMPGLPVALDHCGFPDLTGGALLLNAAPLLALADVSNVHLKVSSYLLEQAEALGDPAIVVDRLAAVFGADRLQWGSDYPQTHDRTYPQLVELARLAMRNLPERARAAVLGGTADRFWGAGPSDRRNVD
jgi:predicted TIM-barrel fold metal-dependent hydrolase